MELMLASLDEHNLEAEQQSSTRSTHPYAGASKASAMPKASSESSSSSTTSSSPTAFPKTVDRLGIVYTPIEIVDFILNSADQVLREEFGQGLTDEGVHILEGSPAPAPSSSGSCSPDSSSHTTWPASTPANCTPTRSCCSPTTSPRSTSRPPTPRSPTATAPPPTPAATSRSPASCSPTPSSPTKTATATTSTSSGQQRTHRAAAPTLHSPSSSATRPTPSARTSANDDNQNAKYPTIDNTIRDTYALSRQRPEELPLRLIHPRHQVGVIADQVTAASSRSSPTGGSWTPTQLTGCASRSLPNSRRFTYSTSAGISARPESKPVRRGARSSVQGPGRPWP